MRLPFRTFAAVLLLPVVVACTVQPPQRKDYAGATPPPARISAVLCHVGPNGGPLAPDLLPLSRPVSDRFISDRGIGGTGGPTAGQILDRGIGGTGIGGTGTGILGVITGFGSICVDGLEVQYDETATVDVDGAASSTAVLRAGQVVAMRADGTISAARARRISVRSEISGQMENLETGSGVRLIGGQPVLIAPGIWGGGSFAPGDWVKVSGLRRQDGVIVASRLDPALAERLVVRGQVRREGVVTRIGGLVLRGPVADSLKAGEFITASGHYVANQGWVSTVVPDTVSDPMALFGGSVDHIVWQVFLRADKDTVWLNGLKVATRPNVRGRIAADGVAIVTLDREQDGSYTVVNLRYLDDPGLGTTVLLIDSKAMGNASPLLLRPHSVAVPPAPMDAAAQTVNASHAQVVPPHAAHNTALGSDSVRAVSLPAPESTLSAAPALTVKPSMTPASAPVAPPPRPIGLSTPDTPPSSSASPASQFMSNKSSSANTDPASTKAIALTQPASRARHVLTTASARGPSVTTITTMTQSTTAVSTPPAGIAAAAPLSTHSAGFAAPLPGRSGKGDVRPMPDARSRPAD